MDRGMSSSLSPQVSSGRRALQGVGVLVSVCRSGWLRARDEEVAGLSPHGRGSAGTDGAP